MMANIESSVSLEQENSNSLTLTTISEAKKLDANLSKPEKAAIARKPKRTKILVSISTHSVLFHTILTDLCDQYDFFSFIVTIW